MRRSRVKRITCSWCGKSLGALELAREQELVCDWCEELPRYLRDDIVEIENESDTEPVRRKTALRD